MSSQLGASQLGDSQLGGVDASDPFNILMGPGSIALAGSSLGVFLSAIAIGSGTISVAGGALGVALSGTVSITIGAGTIALAGSALGVFLDTGIAVYMSPGTITVAGSPMGVTIPVNVTMGAGEIVLAGGSLAISLVRTSGTGNQLYIGDTLFACGWKESTGHMTKALSGDWSASFELDYFGGYDPQDLIGQEVAMFWESLKRFGGLVQSVEERSVQGNGPDSPIPHTVLSVKVGGYQLLTDRVIFADLIPIFRGGVNGIVFYNIWYEKLRQFGVTKGPPLPNVFCGEQFFHYITVTECFNRLKAQVPGYDWWIDDDKFLHYENVSPTIGANAPFTIRNGDRNVDFMRVSRSNVRFRNKQWVLPSADIVALRDDQRLGDGASTSFSTDYVLTVKPIVRVGGVAQLVTEGGNWIAGWQFYYIPGGVGVFAATPPASLETVDIVYPNPFPVAFSAQDSASIAAVGLYEAIWQAKNVFDQVTAEQEAEGLLELYSDGGFPQEAEFEYDSENQPLWLLPGMVIDIDHTFPTALGNFTVEQVDSQELAGAIWKHTITLRSGLGEVTDSQALEQFRISARVPVDSPPFRMTAELFNDLPGITNPGASTGPIKNTYVVQCKGVIAQWDILFADDPPTGQDFQMDVLLNGVSIFFPGGPNQVVGAAGVTTNQKGIRFLVDNTPVIPGDIITLNVTQVGSIFPGANATMHLYIKVPANAGTA